MLEKIKKLFKKRSVTMPEEKETLENVEETIIEDGKDLEASETKETKVETETETVETQPQDTVKDETVVVEEEKVEVENKQVDFGQEIKSLEEKFNLKLENSLKEFNDKMTAKDKVIEEQNKKIEDLEKRVPNSPFKKIVTEEELKTPQDLKRSNVVKGFYGN